MSRKGRLLRTPLPAARPSPTHPAQEAPFAAGNRAVGRVLARQGDSPLAFGPQIVPPAYLPRGPIMPRELDPAVAAKVKAFLEDRKVAIADQVRRGVTSMPEVVQAVREGVAEAAGAQPFQVEMVVSEVMGREIPPPRRTGRTADGPSKELAARISNALPFAPKELRVEGRAGSLVVNMSGVVATAKAGGATVQAGAGPGGAEAKVEGGGASVTATAAFDGTAFGLEAKIERAKFTAKVEKDTARNEWSKWELGLSVALTGDEPMDEVPAQAELAEAVAKAEAALRDIIAHLRGGGSPNDARVKERMKDVKPAIEGVKRAVEAPKGPRVSVGATVKGGDERLGTFAGVSLIIEF